MKRTVSCLLFLHLLLPIHAYAAGPIQLIQGKCPTSLDQSASKKGLTTKATTILSGLMANTPDTNSWQIISMSPLKKKSPYYAPAVKTCEKKVANHTYLIDVLVTKKSSQLPVRMHLFASKEEKGWKVWGLTTY